MTGLNLFTSVANSGREIPAVKWLYGNADDTLFVNRFLTTVGAIRCLKAIKGKKIAIAGGVAEGFVNLEYDKKKVESRFGITIEETDIDKIIDAVLEMKDEEISELAAEIKSSASSFTADEERFVKSCKLICVLKDILKKTITREWLLHAGRASRRDWIFSRVWHTDTFVITGTPLPARATYSDS